MQENEKSLVGREIQKVKLLSHARRRLGFALVCSNEAKEAGDHTINKEIKLNSKDAYEVGLKEATAEMPGKSA